MECDGISSLPDHLVAHILSYLPINDLAKTSVLSKRWEFFWLKVSVFDLTTVESSLIGRALMSLIRRFMELNRSSCLQNFNVKYGKENEISFFDSFQEKKMVKYDYSLDCNQRVKVLMDDLIFCGLQHLTMEKCLDTYHRIWNFVYENKQLVSFKFVNVILDHTMFPVTIPSLRIIHLENISSETPFLGLNIIEKLISASPLLEDLTYDYMSYPNIDTVPQCLKSTLQYVKINKLIMEEESGISQVNYFLENSAVLKKLTLSFNQSSKTKEELESYMKHLTSSKLSPSCQVVVD